MEQLSGLDSLFLYAENENVHQHVSAFGIYDMSTAPGGKVRFRDLLAHFERRLHTSKVFRRRLVTVPHNLDRPYWIDDPDVDIEFHVRHIAVPKPGDWRQLMIQIARLHSRALDLGKPLWEIYVIEGLDNITELPPNCFAVFLKVHHAALDSLAGLQIVRDIHSVSPKVDNPVPANEPDLTDAEPTALQLYTRAIGHTAKRAINMTLLYSDAITRLTSLGAQRIAARLRSQGDVSADAELPSFAYAPPTRFNEAITPNRVVETILLPLARISAIRENLPHISVNDVFLATIAGALRLYLKGKSELPAMAVRALLSLNLGIGGVASNRNSRLPASLFTDIRDPLQRLNAIHDEIRQIRQGAYADMSRELLPTLLGEMPNFAANQVLRHLLLRQVNCLVANVRGPSMPMYMAGAKAVQFCTIGMIADHAGLNISGFSYDGHINISVTACRSMMPDPAHFSECLRSSFEEIESAALRKASGGKKRQRTQRNESAEETNGALS